MSDYQTEIKFVLVAGTTGALLVLGFIVAFMIVYNRRAIRHKQTLHNLELEKQRELLDFEVKKQQELLNATITTQENERETIAGNLHDSVGQMLAAVKLNLSGIRQNISGSDAALIAAIDNATKLTSESIQEVRTISHNLLPGALKDFGLAEALRVLCEKITRPELVVGFESHGYTPGNSHVMELALYRISQELINNALKYAQASRINISISAGEGRLHYEYSDDGRGFNMDDVLVRSKSKGLGFRNIESRVKMIGGTYSLKSAPGMGVQVKISVDLQQGTLL